MCNIPLICFSHFYVGFLSKSIVCLLVENKNRPELTKIIASSSGAMKAEEVAKIAMKGIKSGSFVVTCNFEGAMLATVTAGLGPQSSYVMAFIEVMTMGLLRLVGLFFQWSWYGDIERWHSSRKR